MVNAIAKALTLDLPDYKHQPGLNPRPAEDFLPAGLHEFPTPVTAGNWAQNLAWCFGIRLINEGFFWEAHEALEPVWMKTRPNAREHHLVQGAIQLANCALKSSMKKNAAALKVKAMAHECVERAYSGGSLNTLMGLDEAALLSAINAAGNGDTISPLTLNSANVL